MSEILMSEFEIEQIGGELIERLANKCGGTAAVEKKKRKKKHISWMKEIKKHNTCWTWC